MYSSFWLSVTPDLFGIFAIAFDRLARLKTAVLETDD
jgi:hypothetical protein